MLERSEQAPASRRFPSRPTLAGAALASDHPCSGCAVRLEAFCRVLAAEELARFKALGVTARAEPRQCLFHEGDPAGSVYNLTGGMLKLYKLLPDGRRQVAGFVYPGDFIGLTAQREHAFTAEALGSAEFCRFPRQRFTAFLESHRGLARELYLAASQELATAREQMLVLGRKRASERVASFLLDLFDRMRARGHGADLVHLAMTRTDIADFLGLTKETVSRAFSGLRRDDLIATHPRERVELLDRRRLERLARGEA